MNKKTAESTRKEPLIPEKRAHPHSQVTITIIRQGRSFLIE